MDRPLTLWPGLPPYPVIAAAVQGNPEAVRAVLRHYSAYIEVLSKQDDELRQRLESRLLTVMVTFQLR